VKPSLGLQAACEIVAKLERFSDGAPVDDSTLAANPPWYL